MKEVCAVKNPDLLATIPVLLCKHHGEQVRDVWNFGVNVALRISDLLSIKMSDIKGDRVSIKEGKTGKVADIQLNSKALDICLSISEKHPESVYLFQSRRSKNVINKQPKPLSRQAVSLAFQEVGVMVKENLGTHSMRKTRGFHLYKKTNDIARVMRMLRHSSEGVTLKYIGITQGDIDNDFNELVL